MSDGNLDNKGSFAPSAAGWEREMADASGFAKGSIAEFEALVACYRSGQISERQWHDHLSDPAFAAYVEQLRRQEPSQVSGTPRPVIVRSADGSLHFGYLRHRNGKEVELDRARRISHPDNALIVSKIAVTGPAVHPDIGIGAPVSILLTEVLEIITCAPEAARAIEALEPSTKSMPVAG
jgi:hypothetical protein